MYSIGKAVADLVNCVMYRLGSGFPSITLKREKQDISNSVCRLSMASTIERIYYHKWGTVSIT